MWPGILEQWRNRRAGEQAEISEKADVWPGQF